MQLLGMEASKALESVQEEEGLFHPPPPTLLPLPNKAGQPFTPARQSAAHSIAPEEDLQDLDVSAIGEGFEQMLCTPRAAHRQAKPQQERVPGIQGHDSSRADSAASWRSG